MPQKTIILMLCLLCTTMLNAQLEEQNFYYGFSMGLTRASIGDLETTLIRPIFPENTYNTKTTAKPGIQLSAFVYYRFKNSKFAIEPTIAYHSISSAFQYDDVEEFSYEIGLNYGYLSLSPLFKFYTAEGIHLCFGPQLNLITNSANLKYSSSDPDLGPDLQIQQSLREVLKGNHVVALQVGVGYDTPFGLSANLRYSLGLSDALQTLANGFYFIENNNPYSNLTISVSYAIPFYN